MSKEFFNKNASSYSKENYNININKFMIMRLKFIEETVYKLFKDKNINILDMGCGSGEITLALAKKGFKGSAIDYSENMIKICNKNLVGYDWKTIVSSAEKTNFKKNSFDLVVASGLLEYYNEDHILFDEINRVVKKDGYLVINVTNKYGYSSILNYFFHPLKQNKLFKFIKKNLFNYKYDVIEYLTRKHNIKSFKKTLKNNNFKIEEEKYIGFTILPAPFSSFFNFLTKKIDLKLEGLSNTKLKIMGASYIVLCKKI